MRRKTLIYKTGVEYGDYTLNHIQGCSHGCKYPCYAFMLAKRFGKVKTYDDWINPCIVENTLELLDDELPKYKDKIKMLHLCFTTDPFMYGRKDISDLSLEILKKANNEGVSCSVLTKGLLPNELAQLSKSNEYGITVVSLDDGFLSEYEPNASNIRQRIASLRFLHEAGCKTWVSIEPYPTPNFIEQDITAILEEISFCDKIIFGRIHYNKKASEYKEHKKFFNETAKTVITFCKEHNISYHIKNGTITDEIKS